jgi:hypothetical protein
MPIKFQCPHCKRGLSVKDELAGKSGPCPSCKNVITVPGGSSATANGPAGSAAPRVGAPGPAAKPPSASSPAPPPLPPRPEDLEAEAAALLSGGSAAEEHAQPQTIDFKCPYCDVDLHFGLELAGKKAPCTNPECRRIIDVPRLEKTQRKDWRNVNVGGPSLARRDVGPAPEGAWGSTSASVVSRDALVEAEAVELTEYPKTLLQKVFWPTLIGLAVLGAGGGYWWYSSSSAHHRQTTALQRGLDYAESAAAREQVHPAGQAALLAGASEYFLHSGVERTDAKDGSGIVARDHCGKALALLTGAPSDGERDAGLAALALAQVELGGDADQVRSEVRVKWDEVQKAVRATLAAMSSGDGRREAWRAAVRRLAARGQADRILPLAGQLYTAPDADKAEAVAVAGLELLAAGATEQARKAREQATAIYGGSKPPPLRAAVVVLAMALGDKPPKPEKAPNEEAYAMIGQAGGLARQGKWPQAREVQRTDKYGWSMEFRARVEVAAAAVDQAAPEAARDVGETIQFAQGRGTIPAEAAWDAFRLAELALRIGLSDERLEALARAVGDPALRGRVQLGALQARLARAGAKVADDAAEAVDRASVAHWVAEQAVTRHNVRLSSASAKAATDWVPFKITDASLESLRGAGLPDEVVSKLKGLREKGFETREEFSAKLAKVLGPEYLKRYQDSVCNHAYTGDAHRGFCCLGAALGLQGTPR